MGAGHLQDRGIAEAGSARSRAGRGSAFVAQTVSIPDGRRLGVRQSGQQGKASVLVLFAFSGVHPSGPQGGRNYGQGGMAYLPSFVCDDSEVARGGREDCAGTAAAREQQRHDEPLCAGGDRHQAQRTEQGCEAGI